MTDYATFADDALLHPQRSRRPKGSPRRPRSSLSAWLLRLAGTAVVLSATILAVSYGIGRMRDAGGDGRSADPTPVSVTIAGERLRIPANMFRFESERGGGPEDQVSLALHWPDLAGYTPETRADFLDDGADAPILFLTIGRRVTTTDTAERLINVYQHFFDGTALPAPTGLVGRRLSDESGLGGEEVYFEPGAATPFATHCIGATADGIPATCQTEIRAGNDLSVQIRFRKGRLADWQAIRAGVRRQLLGFGITP